jgi:hypothetical protein
MFPVFFNVQVTPLADHPTEAAARKRARSA